MTRYLPFFATFLAGAVAGSAWMMFDEETSPEPIHTSDSAAKTILPAESAPPSRTSTSSTGAGHPEISKIDRKAGSTPPEPKRDEFRRLLRELVEAPEDEREARLLLLLARLQDGGEESVEVIRDYLRTGQNIEKKSFSGPSSFLSSSGNFNSLRDLLFQILRGLVQDHPELAATVAKECLPEVKSLDEAIVLIETAGKSDANELREPAIAAIERLIREKRKTSNFESALGIAVRLQAHELIPAFTEAMEQKPYSLDVGALLAALWNFPDETRQHVTERLIKSENIRKMMQEYPSSWTFLDARNPEFRNVVVSDFQVTKNPEYKKYLLEQLAEDRAARTSMFFPVGSTPPASGAPGSKEQALGRIALLDELAPFCNTPLLQQHLAESRAKLAKFAEQP